MIPLDLNTIWFGLIGVLLTGYAFLDGFDLGVGALHLLTTKDEHRRLMINAIGPVWDGNEVWLVTGGGALFAAFPEVYATVFSGFYMAFMLLLCMLIFRAVAIEFRSKQPMRWWRQTWDVSFSVASMGCSLLLGVAFGIGASKLIKHIPMFSSFNTVVSGQSIIMAFAFSAAVGIFFGFYPARKASRLDPIEALRYE